MPYFPPLYNTLSVHFFSCHAFQVVGGDVNENDKKKNSRDDDEEEDEDEDDEDIPGIL